MILLKGWLARTETKKLVRGMAILDNAKDDLRSLIGTLDPEELLLEDAADKIVALLEESYEQFLTPKIPEVLEDNFYDKETQRKKGESMIIFLQRKQKMWNKLKQHGITFSGLAMGYITLRDAHLSTSALETLEKYAGLTRRTLRRQRA